MTKRSTSITSLLQRLVMCACIVSKSQDYLQPHLDVITRIRYLATRYETDMCIKYDTRRSECVIWHQYPYYISQHFKLKGSYLLTWLRYSVWIPLYPLGILCEGIIILRNIPYFEETNKFSILLPNAWNFSFHCPSVMKLYLLLLFFPGMYTMMKHMYRARIKKLGPHSWRNKFD